MATDNTQWNPRYINYCRHHGIADPEEMLAIDREAHPGGCMAGFILWMGTRIREWAAEKGLRPNERARWFGPGWNAWDGTGDPRRAFLCSSRADPKLLDPKAGILEGFDNWLTRWVGEHGKENRCE